MTRVTVISGRTRGQGGALDIPATSVQGSVAAASLAELCWVADGRPRAAAVVPLLLGERPAVAVPYAHADAFRSLGAARAGGPATVALALTDPRMAGSGWSPLVVSARPTLVDDVDGSVFTEALLRQELRKHPPSRAYAESALLRRENWWFLPRLVVELEPVAAVAVSPRSDPRQDALLVTTAPEGGVAVDVVRVLRWAGPLLRWERPDPSPDSDADADGTRPPDGEGGVTPARAAAVLFTHDASVPDLERWSQHLLPGTVDADGLRPWEGWEGPLEPPPLPPPLGLRARLRRHRELERGCRAGIAALEQGLG